MYATLLTNIGHSETMGYGKIIVSHPSINTGDSIIQSRKLISVSTHHAVLQAHVKSERRYYKNVRTFEIEDICKDTDLTRDQALASVYVFAYWKQITAYGVGIVLTYEAREKSAKLRTMLNTLKPSIFHNIKDSHFMEVLRGFLAQVKENPRDILIEENAKVKMTSDENIFRFLGVEKTMLDAQDMVAVTELLLDVFSGAKPSIMTDEISTAEDIEISSVETAKNAETTEPFLLDGFTQIGTHWITRDTNNLLNALPSIEQPNVLLVGESGYGKTMLPISYAESKNLDYFRVNCSAIRDPEEWFGSREAIEGSTIWVNSPMIDVLTNGGVLILDEINRVETWIVNSLFALLDTGKTNVRGQEYVRHQNCIIFATANIGMRFHGTFAIDAAFLNRFLATIKVDCPKPKVEKEILTQRLGISSSQAKKIVDILTEFRQVLENNQEELDVSTRSALKIGTLVKAGLSIKDATNLAILNVCPSDLISFKELKDLSEIYG